MDKKGQVFTIDLLMALFIFLLVLTSVIVFLYSVADVANPYSSYYSLEISDYLNGVVSSGADTLVGSPGIPVNWTSAQCTKIGTIGIMFNSYEASPQKLYNLTTLPTGCLSELLRASDSFNISTYYLNGTPLKVYGTPVTAGFQPPQSASYIVSVPRYVVMFPGNVIIKLIYKEWLS